MRLLRYTNEQPKCDICRKQCSLDDGFAVTGEGMTLCQECFQRVGDMAEDVPIVGGEYPGRQ